jgi:hypothetical protein
MVIDGLFNPSLLRQLDPAGSPVDTKVAIAVSAYGA